MKIYAFHVRSTTCRKRGFSIKSKVSLLFIRRSFPLFFLVSAPESKDSGSRYVTDRVFVYRTPSRNLRGPTITVNTVDSNVKSRDHECIDNYGL